MTMPALPGPTESGWHEDWAPAVHAAAAEVIEGRLSEGALEAAFGAGGTDASTTTAGVVELATTAEATTGTDTARAVTPAGLKAVTDAKAPKAELPLSVKDHGAVGDGTTDDTDAIQDALDAAGARAVYLPPGTYRFSSPLQLNNNQHLFGSGMGSPNTGDTMLYYYGADSTDAIVMKSTDQSRVRLEGFRLEDKRTGATAGSGINLQFVYNNVQLYHLAVFGFPTDAIQVGGASGQSSDCVDIDEMWVSAGRYGVHLNRIDNIASVRNIKGDSITTQTHQMDALVNIDSIAGGNCSFDVSNLKLETDTGCHLLRLGAGFFGAITASALCMRGPTAALGGDVLRIETTSTQAAIFATALTSNNNAGAAVSANMVNDAGNSKTYGAAAQYMTMWSRTFNRAIMLAAGALLTESLAGVYGGTGTPEGTATANRGSVYLRDNGSAGSVYMKSTGTGNTGWALISTPVSRTSTQLLAATDAANTVNKNAGTMVFDTTLGKPLWSTGTTATSAWKDATGATIHTPA